MNKCRQCRKETPNPKFCSYSCNVTYQNTHKALKVYTCRKCKCVIGSGQQHRKYRYCPTCDPQFRDWSIITLGDLIAKAKAKHQVHCCIRGMARRAYIRAGRSMMCHECGYDKHIEICHITPLKDLPPETTVAEANKQANIVGLCPNHHWEFDNGLLIIKPIPLQNAG